MSVGKRQHAPRKRGAAFMINEKRGTENTKAEDKENATKAAEAAAGEEVDPDEPRYCLCGDVSYGDMVACENDRGRLPSKALWVDQLAVNADISYSANGSGFTSCAWA